MTKEDFKNLKTGDVVRGAASSVSFVVMSNYGDRVTAVRTADLTHPDEWELVAKTNVVKLQNNQD